MNQKGIAPIAIILIIAGVLVVGGVGIYLWHWYFFGSNQIPEVKLPDKWQACQLDSECVETQSGCCSCGSGGTSTGINKNYLDEWQAKLNQDCKDIACLALYSCKQGKAVCQNKKCEFIIQEDITADWQTYRNDEYGFEIKFPSDLILQKNTGEAYVSFSGKLDGRGYFLHIGYISQDTLNVMGINYCQAHLDDSRCENFKWGNLESLIDWNIETEGVFTQSRAEISKPDGGMIVISILHSPSQDVESFFRQILSTFKFIK